MQVLYQVEVGRIPVEDAFSYLKQRFAIDERDIEFARCLVEGTLEKLTELDAVISRLSRDWRLERMAAVDRNILRMALFEIYYIDDIPFNVTINEAVEIAKKYHDEQSGKFVNGILGKVVEEIKRDRE